MFKRFSAWYESLSSQSNEPKPTSSYSSQGEMLKSLGKEEEAGLCNPLTNIYAKQQIAGFDPENNLASENNIEVYLKAVEEEDHQHKLRKEGKDGRHSAFVDTQTPYEVKKFPAENDIDLEQILPTPGHAIITYPVEGKEGEDDYHQVYLGRKPSEKGPSECIFFDPSKKGGGVEKGNCDTLLKALLNEVSSHSDSKRPPKNVTVATTASSSFFYHKTNETLSAGKPTKQPDTQSNFVHR
ncbi:hypothetical protein [Legionella sp.]|uniref:hypothetical protein n=1 Tax=Legionella sp. TaxID=459 RepID=UPI00321FC6F8